MKTRRRRATFGSSHGAHLRALPADIRSVKQSLAAADVRLQARDCDGTAHWLMSAQFYRGRLDAHASSLRRDRGNTWIAQLELDREFNNLRKRYNARCAR